MIEEFEEYMTDQYQKYIEYNLSDDTAYNYFDAMYARTVSSWQQRLAITNFSVKQMQLNQTYQLCTKNIEEMLKFLRSMSDSDNYLEGYKEQKEDDEEELEDDWETSESFYDYYNEMNRIEWEYMTNDEEFEELNTSFIQKSDFRDEDDLRWKLQRFDKEVSEVHSKLIEFFKLDEFPKEQLIEVLFADYDVNISDVY